MLLFPESDQKHVLDPSSALPTAPQAALYHLNAKFSRHYRAVDPEALTKPEGDFPQEAPARFTWLPRIDLNSDPTLLQASIGDVIMRRRSTRRFSDRSMTLTELGSLLRYSAGITHRARSGEHRRAYPSGGAKYPVRLVVCARAVSGLRQGIYSYDPDGHGLFSIESGVSAYESIKGSCLYPEIVENAAVTVLLIGTLGRSTQKYGERGYRLTLQEAGHVAQNLTLVSTCLGLGNIVLAGFDEPDVERVLGIDGESETMLSSVLIGHHSDPAAQETS